MEFLEVLFDLGCCLLETTNVAAAVVDAVAWSKSRPNRAAIRSAKKAGEEPPSPDKWTTAFQILTPMVITLTILMIIKWVRRAG